MTRRFLSGAAGVAALPTAVADSGGNDDNSLPQLSAATGAALTSCIDLATRISFASTTISAASVLAAGTLTAGGRRCPRFARSLAR